MSSIRKVFGLSKKDKDRSDHLIAADSSGQSSPDPRYRSQVSPHTHVGQQPPPDPLSGGLSAPNVHSIDQSIPDQYPGGQNILKPPSDQGDHPTAGDSSGQSTSDLLSSRQSIVTGTYVIINPLHNRCIYLENPNDTTPLRGHYNPEEYSAQWFIKSWGKGEYTIWNVDNNRYAYCGPGAMVETSVKGYSRERLWRIQARPTGEYTIGTIDNRYFWMLPDAEPGTPVELFDIRTDRKCWWTFQKQKMRAPASERDMIRPSLFEPKPFFIPSSGQRTSEPHASSPGTLNPDPNDHHTVELPSTSQRSHEGAIEFLDVTSVIIEATDLLHPLRAACGALKLVHQTAKSIGQVNEEWQETINRLKFHLVTIENDITKLEEDQEIDGITPALDQAIREPLETYARELEELYKLLLNYQPDRSPVVNMIASVDRNKGMIAGRARYMEEVFERYTVALVSFAAGTISRMQPELSQFHREFLQEDNKKHLNQLKVSNAYGVQHVSCIPGTRLKTLKVIRDWVNHKRNTKPILFFLDVAGSGKSTVAKNMAEEWKREKRLLARFFFSRDTTETMSTKLFCSTVAGAFADLDPNFKIPMDKFRKHPNVKLLPFGEQFKGLVVGPLRAIGQPAILIIDALDECDAKQRDELLGTLHAQHNSIPLLRILATGRPERDIKRWAEQKFKFGYTNFTRLEGSDKDVELYIHHRLQDLPIAQDRLYPVIRHAEGLFIWARIACDLLVNSDDIDGLLEELGKEVSLDYLYKVALEQSIPKDVASRRAMILVLEMILAAREPLSIAEFEMLSPKSGIVEKVVTRLGSVLLYQDREDPIRLLHATFREFLTARSKADNFFIEPKLGHHTLASGCLNTMSYTGRQCHSILSEMDRVSDRKFVSFLARMLIDCVPRTFIYSSTSWAYHCSMLYRKLALNEKILEFANGRLKTWIDLADSWRGLDAEACVGSVLLLARQNMV